MATTGVRGTDFWGGFLFLKGLDVLLLSGKSIYVTSAAGEVVLEEEGQGTTVMPGEAPSPVKKWPAAKVAQALNSVSF